MKSGTTSRLYGVWGNSSTDIFAVGLGDIILHYDGSTWSPMVVSGSGAALLGIWGASASNVFAVSYGGIIMHYDGAIWSVMNTGTADDLRSVWGSSSTDVFAVGQGGPTISTFTGAIVHFDGNVWSPMIINTTQWLSGIWGTSPSDVFAVGGSGIILHYDGTIWSAMSSGTTDKLLAVWGSSATDVFAVGAMGTILHYDGSAWSFMASTAEYPQGLYGIGGSSSSSVFAVGQSGTIFHYSHSGKGVPWWVWPVIVLVLMASGAASVFYWRKKKTQPDVGLEPGPQPEPGVQPEPGQRTEPDWTPRPDRSPRDVGLEPALQAEPGEPTKSDLTPSIGDVTPSPTDELNRLAGVIRQALQTMDETGGRYADEEAANRELATSLKLLMPGVSVQSQVRVNENTTADLMVGNILVECKLELLAKTEANRLYGQLDDYCLGNSYTLIVVVYGEITPSIRDFIQKKIDEHYPGRVRLVTLPHPHRTPRRSST